MKNLGFLEMVSLLRGCLAAERARVDKIELRWRTNGVLDALEAAIVVKQADSLGPSVLRLIAGHVDQVLAKWGELRQFSEWAARDKYQGDETVNQAVAARLDAEVLAALRAVGELARLASGDGDGVSAAR